MKRKYAGKYPELQEVPNNLWKIIEYFMSSDIKLEMDKNKPGFDSDRETFYRIVHKYGSTMPPLLYLVTRIQKFLKEFSKVFDGSCR